MTVQYLQIQSSPHHLPLGGRRPFRAVVIIDQSVASEWQEEVSSWLVRSGCLYMMAWGKDCSSWDDSVDLANLKDFNFEEIPDEKFVMTTWHNNEPLEEVFWFSKHSAFHPNIEMQDTLIIHISDQNNEQGLLTRYKNA
jgi:hypothetical protein